MTFPHQKQAGQRSVADKPTANLSVASASMAVIPLGASALGGAYAVGEPGWGPAGLT